MYRNKTTNKKSSHNIAQSMKDVIHRRKKTKDFLNIVTPLRQQMKDEKKKQKQELQRLKEEKKQLSNKLKEEIKTNKYKNKELKRQLKEQKEKLQKQIKEHPKFIAEKIKREKRKIQADYRKKLAEKRIQKQRTERKQAS